MALCTIASVFYQSSNFIRRMAKVSVLNGPNLNLLGVREPGIYGDTSLEGIQQQLQTLANQLGHQVIFFQSNAEHEIVERIHNAYKTSVDFIIINPAAFTHTSITIRDAFSATKIPFIEVHLSNIFAREPFRRHSYLSDIAEGVISGLGGYGYELALFSINHLIGEKK